MHQAPHALVGWHLMCERLKWRPKGTSCVSREGSTLTKPSLALTQRMQLLLSYQMTTRLTSPLIHLRLSLHRKLNQPGNRSDPWRTGVHAHLLQRSGLQKKRRCPPPREAVLPRGVTEEGILPKRYETFTSDNDWVQRVRCSLLGLEAGTTPSRRDTDTSSHFIP